MSKNIGYVIIYLYVILYLFYILISIYPSIYILVLNEMKVDVEKYKLSILTKSNVKFVEDLKTPKAFGILEMIILILSIINLLISKTVIIPDLLMNIVSLILTIIIINYIFNDEKKGEKPPKTAAIIKLFVVGFGIIYTLYYINKAGSLTLNIKYT